MMKKTLIALISLMFAANLQAAAPESISIANARVHRAGQDVEVTFDVSVDRLNSHYKVVLTPVLYNGTNRVEMAPMTLMGRKRNIADQRNGEAGGPNRYVAARSQMPVTYTATVPYKDWMQTVSLSVGKVVEGCCTQSAADGNVLAENVLLHYKITPHFGRDKQEYVLTALEKYTLENPFLHPIEEYESRYDLLTKDRIKGASAVQFKVGSSAIDANLAGNKELLAQMERAMNLIIEDPNASLKQIMIAGYASPEGGLAGNTALAQRRAEAVKNYLLKHLDIPKERDMFELYNGREDWDGLREMVAGSQMEHRSEVLALIDKYTMEQEVRKTELRQLAGGTPYRYMLENYYPTLRNAGYIQVYYDIDRTATVGTAVRDASGRTTWVDPDSPANISVTRMNRAIEMMVAGDYTGALRELESQKQNPAAYNLIGVCYMMTGNLDQAEVYLEMAGKNNDPYAARNLEEIATARKVGL